MPEEGEQQWRSQDLEAGGREGQGTEVPQRGHSILRIFGCQTMHNFVYLAKVHEPLVKHEKNLGCSACLFAEFSSNGNTNISNT